MRNLSIVLTVLLVACALLVVTLQHRARTLRTELEQQIIRQAELQNRWDELQIKQTGLAKASLIDRKARKNLKLKARVPERTMHLLLDRETQLAAREAMLRWRAASLNHGSDR